MIDIWVAIIGGLAVVGGALFVYINARRVNDLKKIEIEQALLLASQHAEAEKRREASAKHITDMQRVAVLEERLANFQRKVELLFRHNHELVDHIYKGLGPPPPDFPSGLFDD